MDELPSREELEHAFYDVSDGADYLTLYQFMDLCYEYYLAPTTRDVRLLFRELDINNDSRLSIEEVSTLLEKQWSPVIQRKNEFLRDLQACRQTADGVITKDELKLILQMGQYQPLTDEEVDYCMEQLDLNGDKVISEEEIMCVLYANTQQTAQISQQSSTKEGHHKKKRRSSQDDDEDDGDEGVGELGDGDEEQDEDGNTQGCDTASAFYGKGKKTAWSLWQSFPEVTTPLQLLSRPTTHHEPITTCTPILETFVVKLYGVCYVDIRGVDAARLHLFVHKGKDFDHIPPGSDALHQHLLRVGYQSGHVWGNSLVKDAALVSPTEWGWQQDSPETIPTPVYTTRSIISRDLSELVVCHCKTDFKAPCKCCLHHQPCKQLCRCNAVCSHTTVLNTH